MSDLTSIVDLDRYPIADLASGPAQYLISACRAKLAQDGLCLLPDFVCAPALAEMLEEARRLIPEAHHTEHWRATPNGGPGDGTSIAQSTRASIGAVAYDRIGGDSPLRHLYQWPQLTRFIHQVIGGPKLHRSADPLVACMITTLREGDELGWHYDPNDGVVSLILQDCGAGGAFEFAPRVRGRGAAAAAAEQAVLDNRFTGLIRHQLAPGTLSLFNGHRSLHRVAPVVGGPQRIVALFNYSLEPDYVFSDDIHRKFFGRAD